MVSSRPSVASDILIVGGGMVGTPLALMLAQQGWQVTLLDAAGDVGSAKDLSQQTPKQLLEQRCTAISAGSVQLLDAMGLWDAVKADACAMKKVHVSQRGYFGTVRMNAADHQLDALGYVVNNANYLQIMREQLSASDVNHITNAQAVSYKPTAHSAQVEYKQDGKAHCIEAKLTIAVDGVASAMRDAVGISTRRQDYEQYAVLGCVELDQSHNHVAYERFTTGGPLALLPRTGNVASFVYCIDATQKQQIDSMNSQEFIEQLQSEFGHRMGVFKQVGTRSVFPLTLVEAQSQQRDRLLLLGNAMRLVHPVAGQGYNLALRDVAGLLNTLGTTTDSDPGDSDTLTAFVEAREADQNRIVKITDSLARGFRGYAAMPGHIRGAGLLAMAAAPQLGQLLTKQGLGFIRPLPSTTTAR